MASTLDSLKRAHKTAEANLKDKNDAYEGEPGNTLWEAEVHLAEAKVKVAARKVKVADAEAKLEEIRKKDDSDPGKLKKAEANLEDEKAELEVDEANLEVKKYTPEGRMARLAEAEDMVAKLEGNKGDDAQNARKLRFARRLVEEIEKENTEDLLKKAEKKLRDAMARRDPTKDLTEDEGAATQGKSSQSPAKSGQQSRTVHTPHGLDAAESHADDDGPNPKNAKVEPPIGVVDSLLQEQFPAALDADFKPEDYFVLPPLGAVGHFPRLGDKGQRLDLDDSFVTRQVMVDLAERALAPWKEGRAVARKDHIGVDGPSGVGKTVAIYYIVCRLRQRRIFTLYIPNCDSLKSFGATSIREATILAVASIPGKMDTPCLATSTMTWRELLEKDDFAALQKVLHRVKDIVVVLDRQNKAWADHKSLNMGQMFYMSEILEGRNRHYVIAGSSNSEYFETEWQQKTPFGFVCQFGPFSRAETKSLLRESFVVTDDALELVLDQVMRITNGIPGIVCFGLSQSRTLDDVVPECSKRLEEIYVQVRRTHDSYLERLRTSTEKHQAYKQELFALYDKVTLSTDAPPTFELISGSTSLLDYKLFLPSTFSDSDGVEKWTFANSACERVFLEECLFGYVHSDRYRSDLTALSSESDCVGGELGHIFERFSINALSRAGKSTFRVWQARNPSNELHVTICPSSRLIFDSIPSAINAEALYVPLKSTNPVYDTMIIGKVKVSIDRVDTKLCVIQITMNSSNNLGHDPRDIYDANRILASRLQSAFAREVSSVADDEGMRTSNLMYIYWTPLKKDVAMKKLSGVPDWVWVLDAEAAGRNILPLEVVNFFSGRASASK